MMIARWQFTAKFGCKNEAIGLIKEWNEQIGVQTNIDVSKARIVTGSVGADEGLVELEMGIEDLKDLDDFFSKIASIQMHANGAPKWER